MWRTAIPNLRWPVILPPCMILLCLSVLPARAGTYFVDASRGNDASAGTSVETAWRSLDRANSTLAPGDTCLLRQGLYAQSRIAPARSGVAGAPVTYAAYRDEAAEVTGGKDGSIVDLTQRSHVTVRGLRIHSPTEHRWVVRISGEQAQHNRIEQCDVTDPEGERPIVIAEGASHNTVSGCTVHDTGSGNSGRGDCIVLTDQAHDNAVVGNTCYNGCHTQVMVIRGATHNLIVGNDLYATRRGWSGAGINILLYSDDNVVVGNYIHDLGEISDTKCAIQICTRGNTIQSNVIVNVGGYGISPQSYEYRGDRQEATGNLIAHNTVYQCGRPGLMVYDASDCVSRENRFVGNIVVGSTHDWDSQPVWLMLLSSQALPVPRRPAEWRGNTFTGNVFWHPEPGEQNAVIYIYYGQEKAVAVWSIRELETAFPDVFARNRLVNPQFMDPEHGDFHLNPGSPAGGAGALSAGRRPIDSLESRHN
ncbi:MAG: right-handed parallel beta-helix repeat-containing protein [Armatimonadota bacterium]